MRNEQLFLGTIWNFKKEPACCPNCPKLSQDDGNIIECKDDGLFASLTYLHLAAGTAAANTAPLKLTAGTNLTTPENGAFEYDGTTLYFTTGGVRKTVTLV